MSQALNCVVLLKKTKFFRDYFKKVKIDKMTC